jgi:hypothetical protein
LKSPSNAGVFSASLSTQGGDNIPTLQGQRPPSDREKKCVCGTPRTKEHSWKTCQYVHYEILEEPYQHSFKVDESLVKKTRDNLKWERFRNFVQKILTGSKGLDRLSIHTPYPYGNFPYGYGIWNPYRHVWPYGNNFGLRPQYYVAI